MDAQDLRDYEFYCWDWWCSPLVLRAKARGLFSKKKHDFYDLHFYVKDGVATEFHTKTDISNYVLPLREKCRSSMPKRMEPAAFSAKMSKVTESEKKRIEIALAEAIREEEEKRTKLRRAEQVARAEEERVLAWLKGNL